MDTISPSFCASKWLLPNFYLHTGTTSSCHFPQPDKINLDLVKQNLKYIDSTVEKINQRSMMLQGQRPSKCSNCWQVEDAGDDSVISDRLLYSYIASKFESKFDFATFTPDDSPNPSTITVSFDTLCNFSCSYCDPSLSSSWYTDIKINGPYKGIKGDTRHTYQRLGKNQSLNETEYEFLFDKFYEYTLQKLSGLEAIFCIGGEPLMSPNFWTFIDRLTQADTSNLKLVVVTNLSNKENLDKILALKGHFKKLCINASIENIGTKAEFVRNGLKWNVFEDNINCLVNNDVEVTLLATVPGIAIDGFVEFLEWYKKYVNSIKLKVHRLRHPNFQAPQVLPKYLKDFYASEIDNWLAVNEHNINQFSAEQVKNIVTVLKNDSTMFDDIDIDTLQQSAKVFYKEYARRNSFDIDKIFRKLLADWILN